MDANNAPAADVRLRVATAYAQGRCPDPATALVDADLGEHAIHGRAVAVRARVDLDHSHLAFACSPTAIRSSIGTCWCQPRRPPSTPIVAPLAKTVIAVR
jgi:hypothetical protein